MEGVTTMFDANGSPAGDEHVTIYWSALGSELFVQVFPEPIVTVTQACGQDFTDGASLERYAWQGIADALRQRQVALDGQGVAV